MSDKAHHLHITEEDAAGNGGLGRYFLIPGSPSRAQMIAELFDEQERAIITPACGLALHGTSQAERVLDLTSDIAERVGQQALLARLSVGA